MKYLLIAAAIVATTASPTVMAAVYTTASLSNFKITLIDLDLTDNIESKITFSPPPVNNDVFGVYSNGYVYGIMNNYVNFTEGNVKPTSLNNTDSVYIERNSSNIVNSVVQTNESYATNLQASGSLDNLSIYTYFFSQARDLQLFTLSANTRLQITADSNIYLESAGDYQGGSFTSIAAQFNEDDTILTPIISASDSTGSGQNQQVSEMKELSIFIDNLLSKDVNGYINNLASTSGSYGAYTDPQISSVPVPAALPLMASALSLFGFGAMRIKAKKS